MKMLLTSAGITNPSIDQALNALLPKPADQCSALIIPTACYGHPMTGPGRARDFVAGLDDHHMSDRGWKSIGLLELTALPSLARSLWEPWLERTDVLLVSGGETIYLAHWVRESGLLDVLQDWPGVWVGMSAGSLVMSPRIGRNFVFWPERGADDAGLGLIDFAIFPHLGHPDMPDFTLEHAEQWAEGIEGPAWAADDASAFVVESGEMCPVTEGVCVKLHD